MLAWLLLSFVSFSFQHECGVGPDWKPDLKKYPHQGRRLETGLDRDTRFKPLRIHFEYSSLNLSPDQLSILQNEVIPPVQHWFQSVLSVNQLVNDLIFPVSTCNGISIPYSHQTEGLANTDYAIYLTSTYDPYSNYIAWAGPCLQDSGGRFNVLAGSFTINEYYFDTMPRYQQIGVAIHELTHALVFSPWLYSSYVKPDGSLYKDEEMFKTVYYPNRGKSAKLVILPTVVEKVREIYGCDSVLGLELEDYGGSSAGAHWEMKIVNEDYMVSVFPDFPSYSNLTLALFQDSGWYKVDFSYAQPITIGKNEGCERFEEKCISNGVVQPGFCTENTRTCDYTRTTATWCQMFSYYEGVPSNYQYFNNPYLGGGGFSDYCPLKYAEQQKCRDHNENYDTSYGWKFGFSSRCFESSLVLETTERSPVIAPSCYEVIRCEDGYVVVGVGDLTVDCPFSSGNVTVPGYGGVLICPDSRICKETAPCYNSCFGQGKCPDGTCICNPGFGGVDCSIVCASTCKSCDDTSLCTSCYSTATLIDGACTCPETSTWDDTQKVCMPGIVIGCPKECNGCADETTCADCYNSMTLNDKNICECPSGKAFNTDTNSCETVIGCLESCNGCETSQTCLACYGQATLLNGDCICPDGSYFVLDTKICVAYLTEGCGTGCEYCKSADECIKCSDENSILSNNNCSCKQGYYPDESLGSALCNSNFYLECNEGCYACDSLEKCTTCEDSLAITKSDGSCVCPDGYYSPSYSEYLSCYKCMDRCKICESYFNCIECSDTNAYPYDGICSCEDGYYFGYDDNWNSVCLPCSERCETCYNEYSCSKCKEGYIRGENGDCHCEAGFYDFFDGNSTICKSCDNACNDNCGESEACYKCSDTSVMDHQQCNEVNFGYKTSFKDGVITIVFASDLDYYLTKKNFKVTSNSGKTFDTENWWLSRESWTTFKIYTDLTRSDLPVSVVLDFNRS